LVRKTRQGRMRSVPAVCGLILMASLGGAARLAAQQPPVSATVDGKAISEKDIDVRSRNRLLKLQSDEFSLKHEAVSRAVDEYLMGRAAAAAGLTPEQYEAEHIDRNLLPITDAEALAVYDSEPPRAPSLPKAVALESIKARLSEARRARLKGELSQKLRADAKIEWTGVPPRFDVDVAGLPHKGNPAAAVTVLEVGDFECPYCARMKPVLERLEREHPVDVQFVFLNFPLQNHHSAVQAAEAAKCADEQGMYWKMHDILFAAKYPLDLASVDTSVASIGMDAKQFEACMSGHKLLPQVLRERARAVQLGVTATPTLFIDGAIVTGAVQYDALDGLVKTEIGSASARSADPGSPK
jgi:predicted DsbA family dithiol-disulfide isomerase